MQQKMTGFRARESFPSKTDFFAKGVVLVGDNHWAFLAIAFVHAVCSTSAYSVEYASTKHNGRMLKRNPHKAKTTVLPKGLFPPNAPFHRKGLILTRGGRLQGDAAQVGRRLFTPHRNHTDPRSGKRQVIFQVNLDGYRLRPG
jgi:hypothetical protein